MKVDLYLRHYDFVLVSDFDIRISYFGGGDSSMIAVRPRRDAGNLGRLISMAQGTNHAQKKPRQLRFVCPNKKNFHGRKQMVEQTRNSGMTSCPC